MKKYEKPYIEIIELENDQIITTSDQTIHVGPNIDPDDNIDDW